MSPIMLRNQIRFRCVLTRQLDPRARLVRARREGRAENPGTTVLGKPVADATPRDPASPGETIGGDTGIRAEVRRA